MSFIDVTNRNMWYKKVNIKRTNETKM